MGKSLRNELSKAIINLKLQRMLYMGFSDIYLHLKVAKVWNGLVCVQPFSKNFADQQEK